MFLMRVEINVEFVLVLAQWSLESEACAFLLSEVRARGAGPRLFLVEFSECQRDS